MEIFVLKVPPFVDVKDIVIYEATLVLADAVTVFDQREFDSSSHIILTIGGYAFFVDVENSEDDRIDGELNIFAIFFAVLRFCVEVSIFGVELEFNCCHVHKVILICFVSPLSY